MTGNQIFGEQQLMNNSRKILVLFKSLRLLVSPKTWGPFSLAAKETRFDHAFTVSWSQCAEDLVVAQVLEKVTSGKYLDIGAHHPSRFSVTRKLYERGWSGVNVDANAILLDAFTKSRPRDVVLCCAVGDEWSYELTIFDEAAISTVDLDWKERFVSEENIIGGSVRVPGRSLRSILDEYFPLVGPDFLNIDIEGADLPALISGKFENLAIQRLPKVILVENPNPEDPSDVGLIGEYLASFKYSREYVLPYSSLYKIGSQK